MSSEESRIKHSKRLHDDQVKIKKQERIAKQAGIVENDTHRYHKKRALNCGNPNCVMCMNPRKAWGEKTIQERRLQQDKVEEE